MPPQPPRAGIVSFFRLLGLLKYGLALSVLLAYLPFTTYRIMPLHGMLIADAPVVWLGGAAAGP